MAKIISGHTIRLHGEQHTMYATSQDQSFFVAIVKEKFLEVGHPAAILDLVVERLDLNEIYEYYSYKGNQPYHPKMMLKILFYAYYAGIMSCRTIWDAVANRSDFIYLAAGQVPNFRTINDFRLRHIEALPNLFAQIVLMCKELDMIGFEFMAVDGQKIHANASYRNSKNLKGLKKEYAKLKEGLNKLLATEINEHFSAESKDKKVSRLNKKLNNLKSFQETLEKLGDDEKRMNMVDPDAPVMAHKNGRKLPSYTHQTAVDGKLGISTAVQTTQNNDLSKDLLPIVDQSIQNTGKKHANVLADCGFCDYNILQELEETREENFLVPDQKFASLGKEQKGKFSIDKFLKNKDGKYECPAGQAMEYKETKNFKDGHTLDVYQGTACAQCSLKNKCTDAKNRRIHFDSRIPFRDRMRAKLLTEKGRESYSKRQFLSEAVHGDDQKNKGWIQHHLRSLEKASAEFILLRIATNLGKMIKYRDNEILAWGGT
jgi:transposase